MDISFTSVFLLVVLFGILLFVGSEFEDRYPSYATYLKNYGTKAVVDGTYIQKVRAGAYIVLDYLSDLAWPGDTASANVYKRTKKSKKELLS